MKTPAGHDVSIERPSPYGGPAYGCKRCGISGVYPGRSPTDQEIIAELDRSPCNPKPLAFDRERGWHGCPETWRRAIETPTTRHRATVSLRDNGPDPKGWWLGPAGCGLYVAYCPFCGVKLGDLPPTA